MEFRSKHGNITLPGITKNKWVSDDAFEEGCFVFVTYLLKSAWFTI